MDSMTIVMIIVDLESFAITAVHHRYFTVPINKVAVPSHTKTLGNKHRNQLMKENGAIRRELILINSETELYSRL